MQMKLWKYFKIREILFGLQKDWRNKILHPNQSNELINGDLH